MASSKEQLNSEESWRGIVARLHSGELQATPQEISELWQENSKSDLASSRCSIPIWYPSDKELASSNVARWMDELGHETYSQFHKWTIDSREEFWQQAIARLNVLFRKSPTDILDVSQGVTRPAWMSNARLNIVDSCFQADENAIAIVSQRPEGRIVEHSYGQLRERASRVANSLVDAGFKVGDGIGVVMPMTDWSVAIYLGIVMAGCNVVSIADSFAPPEIATRLNIAGAKAVFTYDHQVRAGKQLPLFRKVAEATEIPAIVLSADSLLSLDIRHQDLEWCEFLVDRTDFESVECTVNETINVLFSSGTTGEPKAIPWSHITPIKCAIDGYCHQNIKEEDVVAWPTNLGWMMGPWLIFASLMNRATIALYEDAPMGVGFGRFVQDAKVNMLGVVPTIVKAWQGSGDMEDFDWSNIKVFSSTGESSQIETMVYLSALANLRPVIEYCGGTEIGGGYVSSVVVLPNFPAAFNTQAVGLDFVLVEQVEEDVVGGAEVSKVEVEGDDLITKVADTAELTNEAQDFVNRAQATMRGEPVYRLSDEGEIFIIPPSIGLSLRLVNRDHHETYYANTPEVDGYGPLRRHGDHFRKIESPHCPVYVAGGRADDTMNLGGIKISSAEIERVLNGVAGVVETAAIARSASNGPDELVVFVVSESGEFDEASKIREMNSLIKTQLNPLFRIRKIELIDSMPRTVSGKIMRRKLRDK